MDTDVDKRDRTEAGTESDGSDGQGIHVALLDVDSVARMLSCSPRHVYRLRDGGRMPASVKLGGLVRWNRAEIEQWVAAGCPVCRRN